MDKRIRRALALIAALLLLSSCNSDGKDNSVKAQRDRQYAALATADAKDGAQ